MLRSLLLVPALPAVYVASAVYWLVVGQVVARRLGSRRAVGSTSVQ